MAADLVRLSEKLETCIPGKTPLSPKTSTPDWFSAESIARNLANALRSKDSIDNHGIIGGTSVPFSMTTLLKYSQTSADKTTEPVISRTSASAVFEILRVSANLCMDHDINRGRLLDAEFPQIVLSILRSYVALLEKTPASSTLPDPASILSLQDLKIVKTAFGFLLNAGLDYKPVQSALREMKTQQLVLSLASSIYPPGVWRIPSKIPQTELAEVWSWRSGIAAWSWRVLEVLAQSDNDVAWEATSLKSFTQSLNSFIPPFPSSTPPFASSDAQLRKALINTDVDTLQEYAVQIEALPSEDDDFRGKLITPINSSRNALNEPNTPLTQLLVFIERGEPPSYWNDESENERKGWGKTFGFCKGAIIRGIVNLAGEEAQVNVLWGQNDPLGGWFVQKMVHWVKDYPAAVEARRDEERDDLVICATLCLGNLARREARCVALVQPPVSLVPNLLNLLDPKMDLKLKHGVLGLLKHLSQPQRNRNYLGELGTIEAIIRSKVWDNAADLADVVQLSAIGIVKHLVTSHVWNALKLFVEPENNGGADSKGIDQILDLIRRTDSLAIRNEATRILVNLIKTLWIPPTPSSSPSVSHPPPFPPPFSAAAATSPTASPINNNRTPTTSSLITVATTGVSGVDDSAVVSSLRKNAFGALTCEEVADALGEMIGRNVKYPVLLNEGIMALTLLASPVAGVSHVLSALVVPLGPEQPQQPQQQGQPQQQSSLPGSTSEEATAVAPGLRLNTNVGASVLNGADTQSPAPQTQQTQHPTISIPLDMILYILGPKGKQLFPPELRSNACSLLSSVGRKDAEVSNLLSSSSATAVTESSGKGKVGLLNEVKRRARPIILALVNEQGGFGGGVGGGDSVPISPVSTTSTGTGIIGGRNPQLVRNAALRTLSVWGRA